MECEVIYKLRQELVDCIIKHDMNLQHPDVLHCSQRLDQIVVKHLTNKVKHCETCQFMIH